MTQQAKRRIKRERLDDEAAVEIRNGSLTFDFDLKSAPGLRVQSVPVDHLRPNPRNARKHAQDQIMRLARSIETFGFNVPVLIDTENMIIAGHARWLACKELGWVTVPTISLSHLSKEQVKAFTIADNRLAEIAVWDQELLALELSELSTLDLQFDLDVIGFDMGEIDFRIEQGRRQPREQEPDDGVEPVGPAVSRPGDLWLLGQHRVLCGSALEESSFSRLMQGDKAAMVFVDPPYNVPIKGHASGLGKVRHREFAMATGEMSEAEFTVFLKKALGFLSASSVNGAVQYVCMDWRHMGELLASGGRVYGAPINLCVWVKDNAGMGSFYRSQHELVFVYRNGQGRHQNNVQLGKFGRYRTNVWQYAGANTLSRGKDRENVLALHPTVKPTFLVADAIMDATKRNEVVLDSFLGSGTTLLAAEKVGRRCLGMELDPLYVDTAIRRWKKLTNGQAVLFEDGRSFEEVTEERLNGE